MKKVIYNDATAYLMTSNNSTILVCEHLNRTGMDKEFDVYIDCINKVNVDIAKEDSDITDAINYIYGCSVSGTKYDLYNEPSFDSYQRDMIMKACDLL